MASNSKIEWTHHTFNPWRGCTKVSPGCEKCYADALSKRNPGTLGVWGKYGTRVIASEAMWKQPLRWNEAAKAAGERHRVFCASLADVFEGDSTMPEASWDVVHQARKRLFQLIVDTPNLDWLLLTKRPQNVEKILKQAFPSFAGLDVSRANPFIDAWLDRVWLGTSVEDQKTADERIPHLLNTPAAVRFLSIEPLLGPVNLSAFFGKTVNITGERIEQYNFGISWIIVGGESGTNARPMHPDWVRSIRDQCRAAGVPVFVKQLGASVWDRNDAGFDGDYPHEWPMDTQTDDWHLDPTRQYQGAMCRIMLSDRKGGNWDEWPEDLRIREFPNV